MRGLLGGENSLIETASLGGGIPNSSKGDFQPLPRALGFARGHISPSIPLGVSVVFGMPKVNSAVFFFKNCLNCAKVCPLGNCMVSGGGGAEQVGG